MSNAFSIESALSNFYSKEKIIEKMNILNKMKSISGINSCNARRKISSQQIKQRFTIKTFNFTNENNEIKNSNKKN